MTTFEDVLNAALKKAGSQKDLAANIPGICPAYISRMKKGWSLPSLKVVRQMGLYAEIPSTTLKRVLLMVVAAKEEDPAVASLLRDAADSLERGPYGGAPTCN